MFLNVYSIKKVRLPLIEYFLFLSYSSLKLSGITICHFRLKFLWAASMLTVYQPVDKRPSVGTHPQMMPHSQLSLVSELKLCKATKYNKNVTTLYREITGKQTQHLA